MDFSIYFSAISRLGVAMQKEIKPQNLSVSNSFISVSISWVKEFKVYLQNLAHGTLLQPLQFYYVDSNVSVREWSINEAIGWASVRNVRAMEWDVSAAGSKAMDWVATSWVGVKVMDGAGPKAMDSQV